uniref:Uncharacterized protein n=1 Tax=Pristionchus pacificus TaxID=54126 RepID=A0A2A6BSF8_PRIPA|eukprot:PDM68892.1 hypothetical protein PRIPAC_47194 [Pristionchus pacificus]
MRCDVGPRRVSHFCVISNQSENGKIKENEESERYPPCLRSGRRRRRILQEEGGMGCIGKIEKNYLVKEQHMFHSQD